MIVNNQEDFVRLHGQEAYEEIVIPLVDGDVPMSEKEAILVGHYYLVCGPLLRRGRKNMSLLDFRLEKDSEYDSLIKEIKANMTSRKEKRNDQERSY